MTSEYKEEIDLDKMSSSEIEEYINSQSAQEDNTDDGDIQTSNEDNDSSQKEDPKDQNHNVGIDENKKDPFHGKTQEELKEIIRNQNTKISQQGIEVGDARKQLKALSEFKDNADDLRSKVHSDDFEVISKIAEQTIRDLEIRKAAQAQDIRNSYYEDNRKIFAAYERDEDFKSYIEPVLNRAISENPDLVYEQGWMQTSVFQIMKDQFKAKPNPYSTTDISERKKSASSVGVSGSSPSKRHKPIDSMTAEEYREYAGL